MTTQEKMFIDRMAMKMQADPALTIEDAGRKVCEDDRETVRKYFNARDEVRQGVTRGMASIVYARIRRKKSLA